MRLSSLRVYTQPTPVPKMPDGLMELMDGMARDVLLNNPTNVYEFCANHMEKLLEIRDGPSSKKFLTLDQKILKAQEKVRQRAKERQERFDTEIQLWSKTSNKGTTLDKIDVLLIQEESEILHLRTPVHHVHDLQHASEVEISQDPHKPIPLTLFPDASESSKVDELNDIVEEAHEISTENLVKNGKVETSTDKKSQEEALSKNVDKKFEEKAISGKVETLTDKKPEEEIISGKVETSPDKKPEEKTISEKVEILPDKKPEEETISVIAEILTDKKPEEETISGKVETSLDNKPEEETISGKVKILPDKKPEEKTISGKVETLTDKKPEEETISGKVETLTDKKPEEETISGKVETSPDKKLEEETISGQVKILPDKKPGEETISRKIETLQDKIPKEETISGKIETLPHRKPEEETIYRKVETLSDKTPEDETISGNVDKIFVKKPDDEQIFGKVEIEVIDIEPLKEPETMEFFGLEKSVDAQLRTITEASNESSVSEESSILPKITIGGEHDVNEPENRAEESFRALQLDVKNEPITENTVEISPVQHLKNQNIPENLECNELSSKTSENNSIPPKSTDSIPGFFLSDSVKDIEKDILRKSSEQVTDEKRNNNSEIVAVSKIVKTPISTSTGENDSIIYDNFQKAKNSHENSIISTDVIDNNDSLNFVIPLSDIPNFGELHDVRSNNKITVDNTTDEKRKIKLATIPNEKTENKREIKSTIEKKANSDAKIEEKNTNVSEIVKDVQIKTDVIQHKLETIETDMSNDYKQFYDNSTDVVLHKSDSIENANEDSVSIIESDVSKTDDDSSQYNPNVDLESAAVTIQKVFRSFMFKSKNSTFEDTTNDEQNSLDEDNDKKEEYYAAANLNKERRPLGITRMDTVLQTVNEEKSLSLSTDDSSTLSSAATTIQAHVRGFLVRNRLNSSKTFSMNSLVNSHEVLETDSEQQKNKTVLNIHIVPEEGNYLSRDESLITSMDLSLDGSPPSSVNLHPLSCDTSERRKMLKREDAVQSVSPPSNNSGKLSEDSVKEVMINENGILESEPTDDKTAEIEAHSKDVFDKANDDISATTVTPTCIITISKSEDPIKSPRETTEAALQRNGRSFTKMSSDEYDVITPFVTSPRNSDEAIKLIHSGEFHDVVLPTKVSRNDTPVVRGE